MTLEAIQVSPHVELTGDYAASRGLDQRIGLLTDNAASYARALALVGNRFNGDIASGRDVAQAPIQRDTAKVQIADTTAQLQLLEDAVAPLIGESVWAFTVIVSRQRLSIPDMPVGAPFSLPHCRPDITAANQLVGVAKAAFYPTLSLTAVGGPRSGHVTLVSLPFSYRSVGPSVALPAFAGGLRRAELAATVVAAWRSVAMALALYRDSTEHYLRVVSAQSAELGGEQRAPNWRTCRINASPGLIRATGGGCTAAALPTGRRL